MDPVQLFNLVAGLSLPEAAAQFAAANAPVFPCVPGGKRPLTPHGFRDATDDARRVAEWWGRWPTANIGLPTGTASAVDVVDVDRKSGGSGFDAFERAQRVGLAAGWMALVRTPSGGMHAYYPTDPIRQQPSWQAAAVHVDFRGEGGYVVVPPSVVDVTADLPGRYELIGRARLRPTPVDATALRNFLDPRREPTFRRSGITKVEDANRLASWVTTLGEGERNRGLFWAACRLSEAGLNPAETYEALGPAGERVGLSLREVATTIRSAYRTTHAQPPVAAGIGQAGSPHRVTQVEGQVLS